MQDLRIKNRQVDYLASLKVRAHDKGRDDERIAVALDMLADNMPIENIVKYSHLPESKVLELKKSLANETHK